MNISQWPINKIMQLPDWCFGRRFCVSTNTRAYSGETSWDISEVALPEKAVLWQAVLHPSYIDSSSASCRVALGDVLPTTMAEMDALEPLLPGLGQQGAEPRLILVYNTSGALDLRLRMPISSAGRRLVVEATAIAEKSTFIMVVLTISSIPTEVPDWLVSA